MKRKRYQKLIFLLLRLQLLGCIVGPANGVGFGLSIAFVSAGLHSLSLEGQAGHAPYVISDAQAGLFGKKRIS